MKKTLIAIAVLTLVCTAGLTSCNEEKSSDSSVVSSTTDNSSKSEDNSKKTDSENSKSGNNNSSDKNKSSETDKKDNKQNSNPSEDDFSDAVFIGNSRTLGLQFWSDKEEATFLASTGLNVQNIESTNNIDLSDGSKGTVYDGLKLQQFKRVYLEFGINELGWPAKDVFQSNYENIINEIKQLQPDAVIYVQSELPVSSKAVNTNTEFTNNNIDNINNFIKNAAQNTGAVYIDTNSALKDSTGGLPEEATSDGIHLEANYIDKWINIIAEKSAQ